MKTLLVPLIFVFHFVSAHTKSLIPVTDSLFSKTSKPRLISSEFTFTEGPAVDKDGNVYFTDQPNDRIWKYSTDGKLSLFMEKAGRSNGLYIDKSGNIISCADEQNQLWQISPEKEVKIILKDLEGKRFNGPNDLWIHPKGGIYFTDPLYKRPYWQGEPERLAKENVYYLPKGKNTPIVVDQDIEKPNGIIGTPDGKFLFVADIKANKTYKYEIKKDGTLQNRKLFTDMGSDGMTIDSKGNIYLTGKGVTIFDPTGKQVAHIDIPGKWTANVCFAGKNRDKLFITSTDSVFIMDMLVTGAK